MILIPARAIAIGVSVLLGEDGRRQQGVDAERIAKLGDQPVLLIACAPPNAVMMTVAVAIEMPDISAALH